MQALPDSVPAHPHTERSWSSSRTSGNTWTPSLHTRRCPLYSDGKNPLPHGLGSGIPAGCHPSHDGGGSFVPPVITSGTESPFPPSFIPPSNWLAAVAPPHRKFSGNLFICCFSLLFRSLYYSGLHLYNFSVSHSNFQISATFIL